MLIKILLLVVFIGITIFVGLYFRKKTASVNDFVLGGRNVGPWLSAFAYGATYFSAVVFVGYAGQFGWRFGLSAVWIGIGNALIGSLAAWFVLGRRSRLMSNHLKSSTMPAFFGARYGSQALKIGAAFIVFIFLIPYTASLYNGLSRLFEMAFGVPFEYCIIAMGVLTAIFVVAGGYIATAVNDVIQGMIQLVGIIAVLVVAISSKGGLSAAFSQMTAVTDQAAGIAAGGFTAILGPDPVSLIGVFILTSLGTWGLPQMVVRFYSIKSEKMIVKGAVVSTLFALCVAGGCYFLGSFGRLWAGDLNVKLNAAGSMFVPSGGFDSIVPTILSEMGEVMIGVVIVLVLAASISTLSSLVMTSASTLTLDFIKGHIVKKLDDKKQLLIIRALIVVFIIIASTIAIMQINNVFKGNLSFIADLMGVSWGALAGSFLAPYLYGLYWKRATKPSVWCCFIFSTATMILNIFFRSSFPAILQSPINAGAFCMLAGLVIVPLVSAFTKAPVKAEVDNCFACYEK